jgi:hypothetical protein
MDEDSSSRKFLGTSEIQKKGFCLTSHCHLIILRREMTDLSLEEAFKRTLSSDSVDDPGLTVRPNESRVMKQ